MNKYLIIVIFLLVSSTAVLLKLNKNYKDKLDISNENNITMLNTISRYKLRDSLNVVSIGRLQLNNDQLNQYRKNDSQLIKELKLKPAQVKEIFKTSIETRDSIVFQLKDSCINHKTQWIDVRGCLGDTLYINSTDSISQIIYKEYKHKFLWFRWGTKGYKQKIINYNPNSQIKYAEWIHIIK